MKSCLRSSVFLAVLIWTLNLNAQIPQWQWAVQAGGYTSELSTGIACDSSGNSVITGYFSLNASFESTTISSYGSEDIFIAKYDNKGAVQWAKHAGSRTGSQYEERGRSIALDSDGNAYITGSFLSDAFFDSDTIHSNGTFDMFLARYNPAGEVQWVKHGGGTHHDHGNAVAVDHDGYVYVTGTFKYDAYFDEDSLHSDWGGQEVFLLKYSPDGSLIWAKKFSGPYDPFSTAICVDKNNNVYVTGGYTNRITFDETYSMEYQQGNNRIYVVKFNDLGEFQWAKQAGGILNDYPHGIVTDGNDNVFVTGHFFLTAHFEQDSITAMPSEDYNADIFVAKYSSDGTYQWVRQMDPTSGTAKSVTIDDQGNACIAGYFTDSLMVEDTTYLSNNDADIFIAAFDNAGNYLWTKPVGGYGTLEQGTGIGTDGKGGLYVTGSIHSEVYFTPADTLDTGGGDMIFVAKMSRTPVSIKNKNNVIGTFNLKQNYPNPFNPLTTIEYELPRACQVNIAVYNILGKKIATIVSERKNPGIHSVRWQAEGLSSGIYFYRLEIDGKIYKTRKLVLLK